MKDLFVLTRNELIARRQPGIKPDKYPGEMEVRIDVGGPELVIVEDIYDKNSNSLKLTAAFHMQYTMTEDVVIIDAAVKNLIVVACPYTETIGGKFSKEILSRTELNYYSKQPINGSLHGSLNVDTLLVNINPGTIQLLSHIASSMQTAGASTRPQEPATSSPGTDSVGKTSSVLSDPLAKRRRSGKEESFWDPVPLEDLNLPYLKEYDSSHRESDDGATPPGCDVSKVLEQMEERRVDRIVLRLQTVRVVLESQLGTKSMPMLVLESSMDGEVLSPSTALELKVTLDMSLSYFNDALNQWEQILETLPDEGDRMWSIQFEFSTTNLEDLLAEEDMDEVGCLQTSTNTILLVSRDNLEITVSKSALDMLSNLGQSFEAAYKREFISSDYELGGQSVAPYRIQNRTGLPLTLRLESPGLQILQLGDNKFTSRLSKVFTTNDRRLANTEGAPVPNEHHVSIASNGPNILDTESPYHLLNPGEEIGYIEPVRSSQKTLTLRTLTDRAPRYAVRVAWSDWNTAQPLATPEAVLPLNAGGNSLLQLPSPAPVSTPILPDGENISYPLMAQVTTYLGMRVITLRSTIRVSLLVTVLDLTCFL
ncbi:unnamed protein product [Echinostoma caproni]|uniref:VP13A n=1 Tax=Echinostoma caproni TaxID=27848 RepID=A0A183AC38_9TREM|nr:unnamed protein product [Echinostoma caproni]